MRFRSSNGFANIRRGGLGAFAVAVLVIACSACSSNNTASGTVTTENFVGVLTTGGVTNETVNVAGSGELDVELANLTPQTTITVGLGIGQTVNGQCALLTFADNARVGNVLPLEVTPGAYCIVVEDIGNVTGSDTFTLTVVHP